MCIARHGGTQQADNCEFKTSLVHIVTNYVGLHVGQLQWDPVLKRKREGRGGKDKGEEGEQE